MKESNIKVYGYRWVVLAVYVLITVLIEMQWLSFASITRDAEIVYNASTLGIELFSIVFMITFVIMFIPASYIIEKFGIKMGIGLGAVLTGVFGLLKGFYATDYTIVMVSQIGLGIAQPFILNAVTKVAARWFPVEERATAVGIGTLAQFLGFIIAMKAAPNLVTKNAEGLIDLSGMLMIYGVLCAAGAVLLVGLMREHPPTPSSIEEEEQEFKLVESVKSILKQRDMKLAIILFVIGLGMFNAILTAIDPLCELKGLSTNDSSWVATIMLFAGIVGAIAIPPISDKLRKRKIFLVLAMVLMTPGLIGITFFNDFTYVMIAAFIFGFFMLGAAAPIGFQYCAEVCHPAPESTSQGIILFAGQISGVIFVIATEVFGMMPSMIAFIVLTGINIFICTRLNESQMIIDSSPY